MAVSLQETKAGRMRTIINNGIKRTSSLLFDYLVQEDKVGLITNMKASCSACGKRRSKSSALWLGSPVASNHQKAKQLCVRLHNAIALQAAFSPLPIDSMRVCHFFAHFSSNST